MATITHALIFTPGRRLSDSLQVLLKSNNPLTVIELTDHLDTALQILAGNSPTLVLAQTSSESDQARQMGATVIHSGSVTAQNIQKLIDDQGIEG
jgi:predicted transcriptional regulator